MAGHPMQSFRLQTPNSLIKCILHRCYIFSWLHAIFLKRDQKKLPADHFVCEKYSLHLGVPDMVAALILNDLEKMRQNAKKVNILSRKKKLNSGSSAALVGNKSILLWDRGHWRGVIYTHPNMALLFVRKIPHLFVMAAATATLLSPSD